MQAFLLPDLTFPPKFKQPKKEKKTNINIKINHSSNQSKCKKKKKHREDCEKKLGFRLHLWGTSLAATRSCSRTSAAASAAETDGRLTCVVSSRLRWIKNPVPPETATIAGPLPEKMLAFIRSDLPPPEQKHQDSPKTLISAGSAASSFRISAREMAPAFRALLSNVGSETVRERYGEVEKKPCVLYIKIKNWAERLWRRDGHECIDSERKEGESFFSSTPAAASSTSDDKEREDFTLLYFTFLLEGKCGQLEFQGSEGGNKIMVGHWSGGIILIIEMTVPMKWIWACLNLWVGNGSGWVRVGLGLVFLIYI